MTITTIDRRYTLSIAVQAEWEELERAVNSNNPVAVAINLERLAIAEKQLAEIMLLSAHEKADAIASGDAMGHCKDVSGKS